jgi:formate hydrogenlyase transcriptional activator
MGRQIETIPPAVMEVLKLHDWPGNIRELQNFVERAVILSRGTVFCPPLNDLRPLSAEASLVTTRTLAQAEREHIVAVLRETGGVMGGSQGAAARLGVPRTTLAYRMHKLGIPSEPYARTFRRGPVPVQPAAIGEEGHPKLHVQPSIVEQAAV